MRYIFSDPQLREFSYLYHVKRLSLKWLEPYISIRLLLLEQLMHYSIEKHGLRSDYTEDEKAQFKTILPETASSEAGPLIWFLQFCIGEFSSDPGVWEILARSYPQHIDAFMFHAVLRGSDDVFDCVVSLKAFNAFAYERDVHTYFSAIESSSLSGAQKRRRRGVIHELQDHLVSQSDSLVLRVHPGRQEFRLGAGAAAGAGGDISSTIKPSVTWFKYFLCREPADITEEDLVLLSRLLDAPDRLSLIQASLKTLKSESGGAIQAASLLVCDAKELEAWSIYLKTMNLLGRSLSDEDLTQCMELFEGDSSSSISDEAYIEFFRATQSLSQEGYKVLKAFSDRVLRLHGAGLSAVARRVFETISYRHSVRCDELSVEVQIDSLYQDYCRLLQECWSLNCRLVLDFVARSFGGLSAHKDFAKAQENALRNNSDPLKLLRLRYLFGLSKDTVDDEFKAALCTFVRSLTFTDIAEKRNTKEAAYLIRNVIDSSQADELLMGWIGGFKIKNLGDLIVVIDLLGGKNISAVQLAWALDKCANKQISNGSQLSGVIRALGGAEISSAHLDWALSQCVDKPIKNGSGLSEVIRALGGSEISDAHLGWILDRCADQPIKNGMSLSLVIKAFGKRDVLEGHLFWVSGLCVSQPIENGFNLSSVIEALGGPEISGVHLDWALVRCVDQSIKNIEKLSLVMGSLRNLLNLDRLKTMFRKIDASLLPHFLENVKDVKDKRELFLEACDIEHFKPEIERVYFSHWSAELLNGVSAVINLLGGKNISAVQLAWALDKCANKQISNGSQLSGVSRALGGAKISDAHLDWVLSQCVDQPIQSGSGFFEVIKALGEEYISTVHLDWVLARCVGQSIKNVEKLSLVMGSLRNSLNLDRLKTMLRKIDASLLSRFLEDVEDVEDRRELFLEACNIEHFKPEINRVYFSCWQNLHALISFLGGKNISEGHLVWVLDKPAIKQISNGGQLPRVIWALGGKNSSESHLACLLDKCVNIQISSGNQLSNMIKVLGGSEISDAHFSWVSARCGYMPIKNLNDFRSVLKAFGTSGVSVERLSWILDRCIYQVLQDMNVFYLIKNELKSFLTLDHLEVILRRINISLVPFICGVQSVENRFELLNVAWGIYRFRQQIKHEYISHCRYSFFNALTRGNVKSITDIFNRAARNPGGASDMTLKHFNVDSYDIEGRLTL